MAGVLGVLIARLGARKGSNQHAIDVNTLRNLVEGAKRPQDALLAESFAESRDQVEPSSDDLFPEAPREVIKSRLPERIVVGSGACDEYGLSVNESGDTAEQMLEMVVLFNPDGLDAEALQIGVA